MNLQEQLSLLAKGRRVRKSLQAGASEHEALQAALEAKLNKIYGRYDRGKLDADEFEQKFNDQLVEGIESAFKAGKGTEELSDKDQRWIRSFAAKQFEYVQGFADDLEADNVPNPAARVGLYAGVAKAGYFKGAVSDIDGQVDWVTGPGDSCDDCTEREDNSPYDPEDLPGIPGDGSTACLGNCGCILVEAK